MLRDIVFTLLVLFLFGCSSDQQSAESTPPGQPEAVRTASGPSPQNMGILADYNLVFFLDPNGGPCRMQDSILMEMSDELNGRVNVRYVKTTVPADRNLFYHYGIRALPTLLLADSSGKEIRRMPPGVKNAADVRSLIASIPKS